MYLLYVDSNGLEAFETSTFDASTGMIESDCIITCYVPEINVSNVICDSTNVDVKVKICTGTKPI